jgi:hypothetical protein
MLRCCLLVVIATGCLTSQPGVPAGSPVPPSAPANTATNTPPVELARTLASAALAGDRARVSKDMLTFDELVALSRVGADLGQAKFDRTVDDLFQATRHHDDHAIVVDASVLESGTLTPEKDHVTRPLDFAVIQVEIEADDTIDGVAQRRRSRDKAFRFMFLQLAAGWRLAPHQ